MKENKTLFEDFMDTLLQTNLPREYFRSERQKIDSTRRVLVAKLGEARRMADNDRVRKLQEQLAALRDKELKLAEKARELRRSRNNNRPRTTGAEAQVGKTTTGG